MRALLQALDDDDYLVQYHAIRSLGAIGDKTALKRLLPPAIEPPNRGIGEVAARAVKSLADRLGVEVDPTGIKPWPSTSQ